MYTLQFDGLYCKIEEKPYLAASAQAGFLGYGWLIFHNHLMIARGHGVYGRGREATSNVAEYLAMIEGLESLADMGIKDEYVQVRGDAKCIIDQMLGFSTVNAESLKPLHERASQLANRFPQIDFEWGPRKSNRDADSLARGAMRQMWAFMHKNQGEYEKAVQAIFSSPARGCSSKRLVSLLSLRIYQPMPALIVQRRETAYIAVR